MPAFSFIPRLPSKDAWDRRPFYIYHSLEAMMEAIKNYVDEKKLRKNQIHGELVLEDNTFSVFYWLDELEDTLKKLKWQPTTVSKIYIYDLGYFIKGD